METIPNNPGYCEHCGVDLRTSTIYPGYFTDNHGFFYCRDSKDSLHKLIPYKSQSFKTLYEKLSS